MKFTFENRNIELQDMSQERILRLHRRVQNEDKHAKKSSPSIYMVPGVLRDLSPSSFSPLLVSIGPLHRGDENVQAFEGIKGSYVANLMRRIDANLMRHIDYPQADKILKLCMEKAYTSMDKIKACYVLTKNYSNDEFAEMMVMDVCFMLECMLEFNESVNSNSYKGKELQYAIVIRDLRLLENQIPLFFVAEIFECTVSKFALNLSLIELIQPIICIEIFETYPDIRNVSISSADHILGILHQLYKPETNVEGVAFEESGRIQSAIDLNRAGVHIRPKKDPTWIMGIEVKRHRYPWLFGTWSRPNLTMPVLKVGDSTEYLLRNLIAYEQTSKTQGYFTSYATLMDMLVNNQEDVAKLIDSRVLDNIMGSNEEAANMINSICKNVLCLRFFYKEELEKLNEYCNSYWPKQIAKMRRIYFNSPWSTIALVAGIILFVFQMV